MVKPIDLPLETIPIKDITLDLRNPRYNEQMIQKGLTKWNDKELHEMIEQDSLGDLIENIKVNGVVDPIWVHHTGNGKYEVVEGSRRLVVLRELVKSKIDPPKGIFYDRVRANVFPENTPEREIDAQKIILQTGKKEWGQFNVSSAIYNLINKDHYSISEVATMMEKPEKFISDELENFKIYVEFTKFIKGRKDIEDPRKYSYFQRAGQDVRNRFFSTDSGKKEFFKLITPNKNGETRIRSVSLKGGLYHFNTIARNENILQKFLNDEKMTVDDAMEEYKEMSLETSLPWIKKLKDVANGITLMTESDIDKIRNDAVKLKLFKKIYQGCKSVLRSNSA